MNTRRMTVSVATQLALGDYKAPVERTHLVRRLGGDNGTLNEARIPGLQRACWRILGAMLDGGWHSYEAIKAASGGLRSADRRRRQLSDLGCEFEQQDRGGGDFWFRLANADALAPEVVAKARTVAGQAA